MTLLTQMAGKDPQASQETGFDLGRYLTGTRSLDIDWKKFVDDTIDKEGKMIGRDLNDVFLEYLVDKELLSYQKNGKYDIRNHVKSRNPYILGSLLVYFSRKEDAVKYKAARYPDEALSIVQHPK